MAAKKQVYVVDRLIFPRAVQALAIEVPEGWDPFAVTQGEGVDVVWIRRKQPKAVDDGGD